MNVTITQTPQRTSVLPALSVYDSDRWLSVVRDGFGLRTDYLTVGDGSADQACFPIMARRQGPFQLAGTPLRGSHSEFGGVFAKDADQPAILRAVHRHLRAQRISWMEWCFPPGHLTPDGEAAMLALGYHSEEKHSLMVDLAQPLDAIWAGFAGRARTEVRKAEKNGLTVTRLTATDMPAYMQLVSDVFAKQTRNASFDDRFLTAVHKHLLPDECAHYGVWMDGKLAAGGLFFTGTNRMVFVSGASDHASRKLGANSLIQWQAIQDAVSMGVTQYDMGGTGVGAIDKFKTSFGGTPICYDRYVYKTVAARIPAALYQFAHARGWV